MYIPRLGVYLRVRKSDKGTICFVDIDLRNSRVSNVQGEYGYGTACKCTQKLHVHYYMSLALKK